MWAVMLRIVTPVVIVRVKIAENFIVIETTFPLFLLRICITFRACM